MGAYVPAAPVPATRQIRPRAEEYKSLELHRKTLKESGDEATTKAL
jgi:hypothetical protein